MEEKNKILKILGLAGRLADCEFVSLIEDEESGGFEEQIAQTTRTVSLRRLLQSAVQSIPQQS